MELFYLFSALRRRWWMVLIGALLGFIIGQVAVGPSPVEYESRSVLLIQPPQNAFGGAVFNNDPDRYVIGQISILNSPSLAARVAQKLDNASTAEIRRAVKVVHEPKTEVVTIKAKSGDAARAERIANGFANLYIEDLKDRADTASKPQLDSFTAKKAAVQEKLKAVVLQIAQQETARSAANIQLATATLTVPKLDQRDIVDAANRQISTLESERLTYLAEYTQLVSSQSQLELAANLKVASEVVQPAAIATEPLPTTSKLIPLAGLIGGLGLGMLAALMSVRYSRRVYDSSELEQVLGESVIGELPNLGSTQNHLVALSGQVPRNAATFIDQVCVRAESKAIDPSSFSVAVVGSMPDSGTTSLAVAMAARFRHLGHNVVLVDGEVHNAEITHQFGATDVGGIGALLDRSETVGNRKGSAKVRSDFELFKPTPDGRINVLGLGPTAGRRRLRRSDAQSLLNRVRASDQVVVIDGGSLLDAASSVQLARDADAVVLAVPIKRQSSEDLQAVGRELANVLEGDRLLTVITNPGRSLLGKRRQTVSFEPIESAEPAAEPAQIIETQELVDD